MPPLSTGGQVPVSCRGLWKGSLCKRHWRLLLPKLQSEGKLDGGCIGAGQSVAVQNLTMTTVTWIFKNIFSSCLLLLWVVIVSAKFISFLSPGIASSLGYDCSPHLQPRNASWQSQWQVDWGRTICCANGVWTGNAFELSVLKHQQTFPHGVSEGWKPSCLIYHYLSNTCVILCSFFNLPKRASITWRNETVKLSSD